MHVPSNIGAGLNLLFWNTKADSRFDPLDRKGERARGIALGRAFDGPEGESRNSSWKPSETRKPLTEDAGARRPYNTRDRDGSRLEDGHLCADRLTSAL